MIFLRFSLGDVVFLGFISASISSLVYFQTSDSRASFGLPLYIGLGPPEIQYTKFETSLMEKTLRMSQSSRPHLNY